MPAKQIPEATVTVSAPYHVVGFQGRGHYGSSNWTRRDYKAEAFGHTVRKTSKDEISRRIRELACQATGSNRVKFTFAAEEA